MLIQETSRLSENAGGVKRAICNLVICDLVILEKKYPVPQVHVRFVNVNLGGGALAKDCFIFL